MLSSKQVQESVQRDRSNPPDVTRVPMTFTVRFKPVPKGDRVLQCEVLTDGPIERFTGAQVRLICSRFVHPSEMVPTETLRTWRKRIGVKAGADRRFGREEIETLLAYLSAKESGLTTKQFVEKHYGKERSKSKPSGPPT